MADCLFCKIACKEIPSQEALDEGNVYAFHDIHPQAPDHVLVIPKMHVDSVLGLDGNPTLAAELLFACNKVARKLGLDATGFRLVSNCGTEAGQSVFHVHFHVLGGRAMHWPPG